LFFVGYCAVYLEDCTVCHLADKLAALFNMDVIQIDDMYYKGPSGINVLITDSVRTIFIQKLVREKKAILFFVILFVFPTAYYTL
jgi:hypothetical protein